MPELLILRHANAIRYDYENDFDRRLRTKGKRNAQRIGTLLSGLKKFPDIVYSSPAERAITTAEKAVKSSGNDVSCIKVVDDLYPGTWPVYQKLLNNIPDKAGCVMLVGHNPALEMLVTRLGKNTVPYNDKGNILSPASLAILTFDCKWSELKKSAAKVTKIIHANDLPVLFPFPLHKPTEQRVRPSYYYAQSAVIPFKYIDKKLHIMLVTSSSGKRWVVPKGIIEPGMTAQESAANEALEEGAITGDVFDKKIGDYKVKKWEASCEVKVYVMHVKKQLSDRQWQESHRKRCWVSIKKAQALLDNSELKKIVTKLPVWLKNNQS